MDVIPWSLTVIMDLYPQYWQLFIKNNRPVIYEVLLKRFFVLSLLPSPDFCHLCCVWMKNSLKIDLLIINSNRFLSVMPLRASALADIHLKTCTLDWDIPSSLPCSLHVSFSYIRAPPCRQTHTLTKGCRHSNKREKKQKRCTVRRIQRDGERQRGSQ